MCRLDEVQAGTKIAGRNINNLRYADDTTLRSESEEELKNLLMKMKEESGKSWLKTQHSKNKDHDLWSHHFMKNRWWNNGNSDRLSFLELQNHCRWWLHPSEVSEINRWLDPWKKSYDKCRQNIKKQRHYFANKGPSSQGYGFFSGHVWMWELENKESWVLKNWCFWTVVLEKTLESPLDCKEIKPVNPKGNQSWIFIGRIDADAPILWQPDAKSHFIRRDPYAAKDWGQEDKGTEEEMIGWHHWLNGDEFEQAPGNSESQGGLAFCSPWGSQIAGHNCATEQQMTASGSQPQGIFLATDISQKMKVFLGFW